MKNEVNNRFYYKKDRLNQLRGFCAVVQNDCSARKASKVLNLEPATIGQQIKSLEQEFDVELFDRKYTNKLVITEAGKKFYKMSLPALERVDSVFKNFIKELEYERKNVLNIASLDAIITKLIPFLAEMKKENPNLQISTFSISKQKAFEMLINKELDLAIYPFYINEEKPIELQNNSIFKYTNYWILYKGHPYENLKDEEITKDMIAKYPFAILEDLIYTKTFKNFIEEYNIKSPIRLRYGTINMIKEMVKSKLCISLLDGLYLTEKDKAELIYKDTYKNFIEMNYCYFVNKNLKLKEITKLFLKILFKNAENIFK